MVCLLNRGKCLDAWGIASTVVCAVVILIATSRKSLIGVSVWMNVG